MLRALGQAKGSLSLRVSGSSMWPLLRAGDLVTLAPAPTLRLGDVAACWRDGQLVLHRVVASKRSAETCLFQMKGDHSRRFDEGWVSQEAIIGVLREVNGKPYRPGAAILRLAVWISRLAVRLPRRNRRDHLRE